MKKVLHILNSLLPSGAETMLCCSADYWNKDLEKHVLVTNPNIGTYAEEFEKAGFIIHQIYNSNYWKQHRMVSQFMRENKFDIVHIHRQAEACSYAFDAKIAGASRLVRTVHSVFVFHGLVQIREFVTRQIACMLGVQHVAISSSVEKNERERFRVKTVLIPNWYNENKFFFTTPQMKKEARKKLAIQEDSYCIVSVGNCSPVKNHMSILKVLAKHKEDVRFHKVKYLHVGSGKQEKEEKAFIQKNGLGEKVVYYGFDDPALYLQAADLFVMPSTYEGFGISGIEGLATGLQTIFTNVPGLEDFKNLGFDNLYFCELNDEEIEKCMVNVLQRENSHNSKKQADMVKSMYGIRSGVELYEKVYFHVSENSSDCNGGRKKLCNN